MVAIIPLKKKQDTQASPVVNLGKGPLILGKKKNKQKKKKHRRKKNQKGKKNKSSPTPILR